jgi:hypothetical protein
MSATTEARRVQSVIGKAKAPNNSATLQCFRMGYVCYWKLRLVSAQFLSLRAIGEAAENASSGKLSWRTGQLR